MSDQADKDRAACHGADAIECASNYARYIIDRDLPGEEAANAIVVFEVGEGQGACVAYAASDLDLTRITIEGMLYDSLRAIAMMVGEIQGPTLPPRRGRPFREWLARRLLE